MIRLLIAEDEELARHELEATVPWEDWGFILIGAAEDGIRALELLNERHAELVLTDIRMPGMDGIALMRSAIDNATGQKPLFVILSGHADFAYAREALRLGAFDYLVKPIDDVELEATMRRAAEEIRARSHTASLELVARDDKAVSVVRDLMQDRPIGPGDAYIEAALSDVATRYMMDLSADSVAERLRISGDHLTRLFKRATGLTFNEYLTRFRMRRAMELLRDPSVRIGEVADLCGYRDARYFSTLFRQTVGLTPSEFRHGKQSSLR
ncbi:MAG TPA: helix-turn-helix domain-containing protein [bacterium]|nr:helix-turn-helix domain-containing protein [bacterium]